MENYTEKSQFDVHLPGGLSVKMVIPVGSTCGGNASYRSGSSSSTADNIAEGIPAPPSLTHTHSL